MINLSTPTEQLLQELYGEKEKAEYWHSKMYQSKCTARNTMAEYKEKIRKGCPRFVGRHSEYKSKSGNRWYSFEIINSVNNGFPLPMILQFVYYETLGSIGVFAPSWETIDPSKPAVKGATIYTSHFFLRYCERMNIPYRSLRMLQEFSLDTTSMACIPDEKRGGQDIIYRVPHKGIIKADRRKDNPAVTVMRTFISDAMLSDSDRRRYAELMEDSDGGDFIRKSRLNELVLGFHGGGDTLRGLHY